MGEFVGLLVGIAVGAACVAALFFVLCRAKAAQKRIALSSSASAPLTAVVNDVTTAPPDSSNKSDEEAASSPPPNKSNQKPPRRSFLGFGGIRAPADEPRSSEYDEENGEGGDQSSFSTLDYDYAKAYAGTSGGNSIVSSVGGTQGDNTQEDVPVLDNAVVGERAAALGVAATATAAAASTSNSLSSVYNESSNTPSSPLAGDNDGNNSVEEDLIYVVQVPVGQKLGLVVHSPDGTGVDLPVVHAIKEDSVLISKNVSVGDYLLRVDNINVKGMSALDVSKWIRAPNKSSGTKTLTLMRPRRRPSLLSNPDGDNT